MDRNKMVFYLKLLGILDTKALQWTLNWDITHRTMNKRRTAYFKYKTSNTFIEPFQC